MKPNDFLNEQWNGKIFDQKYYAPSESYEFYDNKTDTYYNVHGESLKNPEVYTPFENE
jgi:hypothetical protein